MPTPEMGLQDMLSTPQMVSASFWSLMGSAGAHSSAQYLSPDWSWRSALGTMVQPRNSRQFQGTMVERTNNRPKLLANQVQQTLTLMNHRTTNFQTNLTHHETTKILHIRLSNYNDARTCLYSNPFPHARYRLHNANHVWSNRTNHL